MKTVLSALLALSVLVAVAGPAAVPALWETKTFWEHQDRSSY
jgi:hypothetical protein